MSHRVKTRKTGTEPNDFCQCGSGKKYKKCCGARARPLKGPKNRIPPAFKNMPYARVDPAMMPGILSRMMFEMDKYTPEERVRLDAQRRLHYR